LTKEKKIRR